MKGERALFPPEQLVSDETRSKWRHRIDWLLEHADGLLTEWEEGFIQDIEKRMADGRDLSLAQSSKLNQIYHAKEEKIG
jgi:hypothetical protein